MFQIQMLPAERGDAFMIRYGDPLNPRTVLIDGGPYKDYTPGSREELAWKQALAAAGPELELLVITHVDADHIEGAINLLLQDPLPLQICEVWFNGWEQIGPKDQLGPVEGEVLSTLIKKHGLEWNQHFPDRTAAWMKGEPFSPVRLEGGLQLTLLSPDPQSLVAMRKTWTEDVTAAGLNPGQPVPPQQWPSDLLGDEGELDVEVEAAKAMSSDSSKANGTSIAFLAEYEGKTCLFGADARPPVLKAGLKAYLQARGLKTLKLDAFKVPHHGSKNNLSREMLALLDCRRYLISTDGSRFKHPDREAMARILKRTQQDAQPAWIGFNYRTDFTRIYDEDKLKRRYHYETEYAGEDEPGLVVDL